MPPRKATTDKNPLKRTRDGSRADSRASEGSSSSQPKTKVTKAPKTPVGSGMKQTLLNKGKDIERDPLQPHRKQAGLPRRSREGGNQASSSSTPHNTGTSPIEDDDLPVRPSKRAKTIHISDDDGGETPAPTPKPSQRTTEEADNNPPPKRSTRTTVEDSEDDEGNDPAAKKSRKTTIEDVEDEDDNAAGKGKQKAESEEEILRRKMKTWTSPIYGFFKPAVVEYVGDRVAHTFVCSFCKWSRKRYQDTTDRNSTKALLKHVESCMGKESLKAAVDAGKSSDEMRKMLSGHAKGGNKDIRSIFDGQRKAGVHTYSNIQHTPTQTRAEIVRWVSENCRPFEMIADRGFHSLMKTGRPMYWIPHPTTVARDTKKAFAKTRIRIAHMLQAYPGKIHFATDAWTSGNHGAYVAVTAHLMDGDESIIVLLDFLEVPESHTGATLARELIRVLMEFGIAHKLGCVTADNATPMDVMAREMEGHR